MIEEIKYSISARTPEGEIVEIAGQYNCAEYMSDAEQSATTAFDEDLGRDMLDTAAVQAILPTVLIRRLSTKYGVRIVPAPDAQGLSQEYLASDAPTQYQKEVAAMGFPTTHRVEAISDDYLSIDLNTAAGIEPGDTLMRGYRLDVAKVSGNTVTLDPSSKADFETLIELGGTWSLSKAKNRRPVASALGSTAPDAQEAPSGQFTVLKASGAGDRWCLAVLDDCAGLLEGDILTRTDADVCMRVGAPETAVGTSADCTDGARAMKLVYVGDGNKGTQLRVGDVLGLVDASMDFRQRAAEQAVLSKVDAG